jgi:hypothetical protein
MNTKAFLKTAEVMIAIVIAATFLVYIFPSPQAGASQPSLNILKSLENNEKFRECVLLNNTCIDADAEIRKYLPQRFKYSYEFGIFNVSDAHKLPEDLPADKTVYAESIFISGNDSEYYPKIAKLFYWSR